jgi:4-alpha-glucanotransferase
MSTTTLDDLAARSGIAAEWRDLEGTIHVTPPETKAALLSAMGYDLNDGAMREYVQRAEQEAVERRLPAEYVIVADTEAVLSLNGGGRTPWTLTTEGGDGRDGYAEDTLVLPPLAPGYHRLQVDGYETLIFAAPPRAPGPQDIGGKIRLWGVTAALYAFRSARNAGVGDYADLAEMARTLGRAGADFLGVNPLHALGVSSDIVSPYSPSHRLFLNTRHIAVDRVPDMAQAPDAGAALAARAPELERLRRDELIDYGAVSRAVEPILKSLFDAFEALPEHHPRKRAFHAFRADRGPALERFCLFETLSVVHGSDWRTWPANLRDPQAPAVTAFADGHGRDLAFHAYLQWLADTQLADAQLAAVESGMALGLYTDLAVGVRPDGAEPWSEPGLFARGISLGVPPDYFNAEGQTWGLLPFNPAALRAARYRPFIETIRAVARHAGMIRIDHVIGLERCFWVPEGALPGGYVANSLETLLAIIRIEAWRTRAVVIGEDLGVVPDGFRERMTAHGLLGCSVVQFERSSDGGFRHPGTFAETNLASFGTHDTPTLAGYWQGRDIDERRRIGQIDDADHGAQHQARAADRLHMRTMTGAAHTENGDINDGNLRNAVHSALANRASALAAVQLDDIAGEVRQPNMPGTTDAYPNWRVRNTVSVEDWPSQPSLAETAALFGGGQSGVREQGKE